MYTTNILQCPATKSSVSIKPGRGFRQRSVFPSLAGVLIGRVFMEDDIMTEIKGMSRLRQTITSAAGFSEVHVAQNGCSDTNIVSRMMELPLKLMTLLTVTISRSSTTCLGPLMGRDSTSVALTLLVCLM